MRLLKCSKIGLVIAVLLAAPMARAVVAEVAGAVSTGATISQVFSGLDELIDRAREAGDYLTVRAAMEAKGAIEAWRDANKDLLDTAFAELNASQQQMFENARQLTDRANNHAENRLETIRQLTTQLNQAVESLPASGATYVTHFSPRVAPAQSTTAVSLHVSGVNLDKGDPVLTVGRLPAKRMLVGPMEVRYEVPLTALNMDPNKLTITPLKLRFSTPKAGFWNKLWGTREFVERELPVITLPSSMGHFVYVIETTSQQKEVTTFTAQQQEFKGKNENKLNIAKPPEGWRWDWSQGVAAFSQVPNGGEAGHCNGVIANSSSPDGITHSAHLDMIKQLFPLKVGPGWQKCAVKGPIYRMNTVVAKLPAQTGNLTWTSDQSLTIPPNTSAIALNVSTFDGRKRTFTGAGEDKFFDVLRGGTELVITPRQPPDL